MRKLFKIVIGLIIITILLGVSIPDFTRIPMVGNFINLDKEQQDMLNNFGTSVVEAQNPKFRPNQNLIAYEGKVPVLMYHVIGNEYYKDENENVLKLESFQEQMKWLYENGYNTITLDQLYNFVKDKSPLPPKPIVLTFDDGNIDSYNVVFPTVKKYNFTATMFIITRAIGIKGKVNEEQIKEMADYGITIGSHTMSHVNLASLNKSQMRKEIIESKEFLQNMLGLPVEHFCYPAGRYDNWVLEIVKEAGYLTAVTTHFGRVDYGDDLITLVRVRINRSDSLKGFIQKLEKSRTSTFSTPRHGDKKNTLPVDDGELGIDNLQPKIDKNNPPIPNKEESQKPEDNQPVDNNQNGDEPINNTNPDNNGQPNNDIPDQENNPDSGNNPGDGDGSNNGENNQPVGTGSTL